MVSNPPRGDSPSSEKVPEGTHSRNEGADLREGRGGKSVGASSFRSVRKEDKANKPKDAIREDPRSSPIPDHVV